MHREVLSYGRVQNILFIRLEYVFNNIYAKYKYQHFLVHMFTDLMCLRHSIAWHTDMDPRHRKHCVGGDKY